MKNNIVWLVAGIVAIGLGVVRCGGGGGGSPEPQPLGLFDKQSGNTTNSSASTSPAPTGTGDELLVSELAMGDSGAAGSTGKSLSGRSTSIPSLPILSFVGSGHAGKSLDSNNVETCIRTGASSSTCKASVSGQVRGTADFSALFHEEEATETRHKGSVQFKWNFVDFTFSQNTCQRDVQVTGIFGCTLDFDAQKTQTNITVAVSGLCNSAEATEHTMQVWIGGKEHRIGYDLTLSYNETIPLTVIKVVFLKDMNIKGTVSFDGVTYSYETLKSLLGNQCQ